MTTPSTLLELFQNHVKYSPDQPFLVEDVGVQITYQQASVLSFSVLDRLRVFSPFLVETQHPTFVIISHNNSLVPLSILACWNWSGRAVLLSVSADPSLWVGMIKLVDPNVILVAEEFEQHLAAALRENSLETQYSCIITLSSLIPPDHRMLGYNLNRGSNYIPSLIKWIQQERLDERDGDLEDPPVDPSSAAITLFTSSAIDWETLKAVTYSHEVLFHSGRRAMLMLGGDSYSSKPKKHLGWLPLSHCFEFCITFCGVVLNTGGCYIFFNSWDVSRGNTENPLSRRILDALEYHSTDQSPVTALTLIPAVLHDIVPLCSYRDMTNLRMLSSLGVGGAKFDESIFQWAALNGISCFDCSGATELAGTICIRRTQDSMQLKHGLEVIPELMGVLEKEAESDLYGELIILGNNLPKGYEVLNNSRNTNWSFTYDPSAKVTIYRTGDIYSIAPSHPHSFVLSGQPLPRYNPNSPSLSGLTYVGRNDDQITLRSGIKIDALALEDAINKHPNIYRSAVMANVNADGLIALLQLSAAPSSNSNNVLDFISNLNLKLAFEKRLKRDNIFFVKQLPLTTKLTVNRKKLKQIFSTMTKNEDIPSIFPPPNSTVAIIDRNQRRSSTVDENKWVKFVSHLSNILSIPESYFTQTTSFSGIPLTSLSATLIAKSLNDTFSVEVTPAQLYGIHTLDDVQSLIERQSSLSQEKYDVPGKTLPVGMMTPPTSPQSIVISGASCRFVGGIDSISSYWSALLSPDQFLRTLNRSVPASRWDTNNAYLPHTPPMGFLEDRHLFNIASVSELFGYSKEEFLSMTPNSRIALQLGYEAIQDACIAPKSLAGKKWGIYTSMNDSGWRERRVQSLKMREYATGMYGAADEAAGSRLAYFLDLTGPSVEIKSACSSSAAAVHYASLAIKNGDCDAALIISATTHFHPAGAVFRNETGISSNSGVCIPFSERADGFVPSEGGAAIVLQREGETSVHPYGKLLASTITQDGRSRGFFSPNPFAQTRLLKESLRIAGLTPDMVSFVESHGTGTPIGDSIELQSILDVYESHEAPPLYIMSGKGVIGHTEETAGLAGVIKTLLCLHHNTIPPQPASGAVKTEFDKDTRLTFPRSITPLPGHLREQPHIGSVSSFGLSGTLVNIIIEEVRALPPTLPSIVKQRYVFLLSSNTDMDLRAHIKRLLDSLNSQTLLLHNLDGACRTSQRGRDHLAFRRAWVVTGWNALIGQLSDALLLPKRTPRSNPRIGLWFGMPLFVGVTAHNTHRLYQYFSEDTGTANWCESYAKLKEQLNIARCLSALGCDITVVGGEWIAEYLAAIFAEVIPEDAVFCREAPERTALSTLAVRCDETVLKAQIANWSNINGVNILGQHSSQLYTLCGQVEELNAFLKCVSNAGDVQATIPSTILSSGIAFKLPHIPIISAHLGGIVDQNTVTNPVYWENVPSRTFCTLDAITELNSHCDVVVNLSGVADIYQLLGERFITTNNTLEDLMGKLFEAGCNLDWNLFSEGGPCMRIPGYGWAEDSI